VTRIRRLAALALAAVTASVALAGCSSTVALSPAPQADDPACAEVTVRLPDSLDGQQRRWTDAQATGAWGNPASVLLTCGVQPPGPTTLPCKSANGVDWIIDSSHAPRYRVTTFGRKPAVQIYLDNRVVSSADVLDALSTIVSVLPRDGQVCTPSN
jgi:hypothetical protein